MENNLTYTSATEALRLPYLSIDRLLTGFDAALKSLYGQCQGLVNTAWPQALEQDEPLPGNEVKQAQADKPSSTVIVPKNTITIMETIYKDQSPMLDFSAAKNADNMWRKGDTVVPEEVEVLEKTNIANILQPSEQYYVNTTETNSFHALNNTIPALFSVEKYLMPTDFPDKSIAPEVNNSTTIQQLYSGAIDTSLLEQQQYNVAGGDTTSKNYNITFEHLIGTVNNTFEAGQSPQDNRDFMQQLTEALQTIINDTNYSI